LFENLLKELEEEGLIFKNRKKHGYGFLIPDDENMKDIFIPSGGLNGAMRIGDKRAEGEIIKIVKRANKTVVGTFESSKYFGFVVPDDPRISGDIFKVVAEIVVWPEKKLK